MGSAKYHGSGQAIIQVAIMMVLLFALLGLAIDGGHLYAERRHMQNAADAGALAGARELCLGNGADAAVAAAQDYAVNHNTAQTADVTVDGNTVNVVAGEVADTFVAGIIGVNSASVQADAAAACGKAISACGVLPVTFPYDVWDEEIECGDRFYVWDDENKELNCEIYDCDLDDDGKNEVVGGGTRGWVDFGPAAKPYDETTPCGKGGGCGGSELVCWIENSYPANVKRGDCISSAQGVKNNARIALNKRVPFVAQIPLYSGPCDSGYCSSKGFRVEDFGCVRIFAAETIDLESKDGDPSKRLNNIKVITVERECNSDGSSACLTCGGTTGNPPGPGDLTGVSLIK